MDDLQYLWPLGVVWHLSAKMDREESEEDSKPLGDDFYEDEDHFGLAA